VLSSLFISVSHQERDGANGYFVGIRNGLRRVSGPDVLDEGVGEAVSLVGMTTESAWPGVGSQDIEDAHLSALTAVVWFSAATMALALASANPNSVAPATFALAAASWVVRLATFAFSASYSAR
jgi:multisubunit Na+/H+ antiporter MnhC subunit